jgi:hypothetical protein
MTMVLVVSKIVAVVVADPESAAAEILIATPTGAACTELAETSLAMIAAVSAPTPIICDFTGSGHCHKLPVHESWTPKQP